MESQTFEYAEPGVRRDEAPHANSKGRSVIRKAVVITIACVVLYGSYSILSDRVLRLAAGHGFMLGDHNCSQHTTKVPQYFQTTPELWAGPTATGKAPFLAQTGTFEPTASFAPNNPLETGMPIVGQGQNESIFHLMAHLSPYFSNVHGFGVKEYPLPPKASIAQVQMLSRHGKHLKSRDSSRYSETSFYF